MSSPRRNPGGAVSKNKPPTSRFQEGSTKFPKLVDAAGEAGGENSSRGDPKKSRPGSAQEGPAEGMGTGLGHRRHREMRARDEIDLRELAPQRLLKRFGARPDRRGAEAKDAGAAHELRAAEVVRQRELSECKLSSSKTMTQAFEDVTVMTERIKKTEESYLKCKIDKEHLEFEFQTEISAMSRKLSEMEHAVYTAKVESDKAQREAKGHQQVVKQLEVACKNNDAEKEKFSQKIAVLEEENVFLRTREVQLRQELDGIQAALDQETSQAKAQMSECLLVKQEYESKVVALQLE
eukprot:99528-Hanusia_phi.AAC.1